MSDVPNEIRKETLLQASLETVWSAISDSEKFGAWFGAKVAGPFVAGQRVKAQIQPTQVDAAVAKTQEGHAGTEFFLDVERVEAPRRLTFRWAPGAAPEAGDPTTLVCFELEAVSPEQTRLVITESGFAQIPLERRAKAFADNEGGWAAQLKLVAKYLQRVKA